MLAGSPLSAQASTWRNLSYTGSRDSLKYLRLVFSSAAQKEFCNTDAKCRTNELEPGFLWISNKGKAQNRVVKKAKYIQNAEKFLGHTNMCSLQVPKDFVE